MATIKSFTSLEQSKKLAEILQIESADNVIVSFGSREGTKTVVIPNETLDIFRIPFADIRETTMCWSLAALLSVLLDNYIDVDDTVKHPSLMKTKDSRYMVIYSAFQYTSLYNNPVDACYEMIIKLHELNLL